MRNGRSVEVGGAWERLFDALDADNDEVAGRVREAMRAGLRTYRALPPRQLDTDVRLGIDAVLRAARTGRDGTAAGTPPSGDRLGADERTALAALGERRAQQGIPVDEMLRAWRIGVDVVVGCAREQGRRLGIPDGEVLEFVQVTLAWSDVAMAAAATAHRHTERRLAAVEGERRTAFVRGALVGAMPESEVRLRAEAHGLDPTAEYMAIRCRPAAGAMVPRIEEALGFRGRAVHRVGIGASLDGELAGFAMQVPRDVTDAVVGVGPPRPLERLAESHDLATRALLTAVACGLEGVHGFDDLGLRAAVALDVDVGGVLAARYLEPLARGGSGADLVPTLRAFLESGMRVERTAVRLFVHQNTVRYRLSRFEELTGASLRDAETVAGLWWALQRDAMRL